MTGSDVDVSAVVVRNTKPQASDQMLGRGISIQYDPVTGARSTAAIHASVIEANVDVGICAVDADVTIDATLVRATAPRAADGAFGDGIAIGAKTAATLDVEGSLIEGSARAGVSSFGAIATLAGNMLECNPIHLDAELFGALEASFDNAGGNQCGCAGEAVACKVLSSSFTAPEPIDPVGQ